MSYYIKNADGTKQTIPVWHPAHGLMKAQVKAILPITVLGFITLGVLGIGFLTALLTGQWGWVLFGIAGLVLGRTLTKSRFMGYGFTVIGFLLLAHWGVSATGIMLVVIPFVIGLVMRVLGRNVKTHTERLADVIREHPLA